jgi:hypothetical protein
MAKKYTPQCACGAIKFEFNTDPTFYRELPLQRLQASVRRRDGDLLRRAGG